MKKQFTTAMMMAAAIASAQAQVVLEYDGGAVTLAKGEKVDSVNWCQGETTYEELGGTLVTGAEDGDRTVVNVVVPEDVAANQPWMRVLKFDGLKVEAGKIYRVRTVMKGDAGTQVQIAMMTGDENCDMPWVGEKADGGKDEFRFNVTPGAEEYTTQTAMFYYNGRELQDKFYADYNKAIEMPDNTFLRLSFMNSGEYWLDNVVVEEAKIAGVSFNGDCIKVDFGFPTNAAALAAATEEGTLSLDPSIVTVTVGGEEVSVYAVEVQNTGLLIFLDEELAEDAEVVVSFKNENTGLKYSGALTPGDGTDVVSFEGEAAQYDAELSATSVLWQPAKLVSASPADGSFELDENTNTFTFTFNKEISEAGEATLVGNGIEEEMEASVDGNTVTYKRAEGAAPLAKGAYSVIIPGDAVLNSMGVGQEGEIRVDFEVGKVQVAEIQYGEPVFYAVEGENGNASTNWTSYKGEDVWEATGADQRTFAFPESGKYSRGFYLSQRGDESASLTYGEKPEYPFAVPEGDVQFTIYASAWQGNTGNFLYELTNAAGDIVANGSATAEIHQPDQGTPAVEVSRIQFNVEGCEAGNYVLKLTTNSGGFGNAIIVWGVEAKTYKMGTGDKVDNEVVVNERFASVSNDGVPAAGTGWHVYQNNILLEPGSVAGQRTRFMNLTKCSGLSIGFYNRDLGGATESNYMTYGEQTHADGSAPCANADGEPIEEPVFTLESAKYSFSWAICNWKGDSQTYYFQILDGETGEVVYSREDVCTVNTNGNANQVDAQKVEFNWIAPKAGAYIMKWYMTGEAVVGNIKVEKVGSLAVYWHNQLNEALAAAKEARANYNDDRYRGTTRNAFDAEIAADETPDYHIGTEFQAAIDRLAAYTKAMKARLDALNEYDAVIGKIATLMEDEDVAASKFARLEAYRILRDLNEQYAEVDPTTLEDEVLLPVQNGLTENYNAFVNLRDRAIGLITEQLGTLAAEIVALDDEYELDETVVAVEDALTDDQDLADKLQKIYTYVIYSKIAGGVNIFETEEVIDEELELTEMVDSPVEVTGYIRNANFYYTSAVAQPGSADESNAGFPGWTFSTGVAADWGWGGWNSPNNPVAGVNITNSQAGTRWGNGFTVSQELKNLPVGAYKLTAMTCDRSHVDWVDGANVMQDGYETTSYIYAKQGEEELTQIFNISDMGQYYALSLTELENINVAEAEGKMGTLTIGAVNDWQGGFSASDTYKLYMVAKADGFDYAAAAASLKEQIEASVEAPKADRTDAPAAVTYFGLDGRRISAPKGVSIKVERWADGYMRVSKTIVK